MEQRDPDAESTATQLITIFSNSFRNISFTLHPGDISGEVAGKSSNVSWAARQLSHNYVDPESRKNCVITVMDCKRAHSTRRPERLIPANRTFSSRHPSFLELFPPADQVPPGKPTGGGNNALRNSYHLRPELPRSQPARTDCRYLLVRSRIVRSVQGIAYMHPNISLLISDDFSGRSWGVGYRSGVYRRGPPHVPEMLLCILRTIPHQDRLQPCESKQRQQ
jgi:hypothetical protein